MASVPARLLAPVLALVLAACAGGGGGGPSDTAADTATASDAPASVDLPQPADVPPDSPPPPPLAIAVGVATGDLTPTFEPYTDENGNQRWDEGEPFEDADGDDTLDSLYVGGFGVRQPTGVHDPLRVRAFALQLGAETWAFAAMDTFGVGLARIDDIKQRVVAAADPALGLTPDRVIVASTHTHHAPDTIGNFGPESLEGAWDPDYLALVVERTAAALTAATAALEPAELIVTEAEAGAGFVRDIDPPEILDASVGIVQARAADGSGRVLLTAVSIANHPEAIWKENTLLSADYPGVLCAALEDRFGGTAVFFAGALGLMQSPAELGEAGFERAQLLATAYVDVVAAALAGAAPLPSGELAPSFAAGLVTAPLQNLELFAGIQLAVIDGYQDRLYKTGDEPCKMMGCIDVPVAVLRLGRHLTVVTIPGEATPELVVGGIVSPDGYEGPHADAPLEPTVVEHLATPHRFVIGLANAEVGYLYPKRTHDPPNHFSQGHGPGADAAWHVMTGLTRLMDEANAAFE